MKIRLFAKFNPNITVAKFDDVDGIDFDGHIHFKNGTTYQYNKYFVDWEEDVVSIQTIKEEMLKHGFMNISQLDEQEIGHCKDCKWQKDSDGVYRRGINAESQCPINRREVYEGYGYCFLFKPKE